MNNLDPGFVDDIRSQVDFHIRQAVAVAGYEVVTLGDEHALEAAITEAQRYAMGWVEVACLFSKNESYYRGLLDQIGETIGEEAYLCDDGISKSTSVLRAKLPELVRKLKDANIALSYCPGTGFEHG